MTDKPGVQESSLSQSDNELIKELVNNKYCKIDQTN